MTGKVVVITGATSGIGQVAAEKLASLGGRLVQVERLRARRVDGRELSLPSWRAWSGRGPLQHQAMGVLAGVSTRHYARSLEPLPSELKVSGIGGSVASERSWSGPRVSSRR